jgi:hypothetical protein
MKEDNRVAKSRDQTRLQLVTIGVLVAVITAAFGLRYFWALRAWRPPLAFALSGFEIASGGLSCAKKKGMPLAANTSPTPTRHTIRWESPLKDDADRPRLR